MSNTTPSVPDSSPGYHETKKHAEDWFPYNVYPCTIPQDFPRVYLHWQDTMELIYIKKGAGIAQVDFDVLEVHSGDIVLVPPGHLHGLRHLHHQRMEYENIIFDMNFLRSGNMDLCWQKYLRPIQKGTLKLPPCITPDHDRYPEISHCLNASDTLCSTCPPGYELEVKANLLKLFSLLFQMGAPTSLKDTRPENTEKLKSVLHLIETSYRQPLSIEETAGHCGYSASHFMRWFKNTTGTSFTRYLNGYRLEKALEELRSSDKTVLEIAENNGFGNLSNFNRLFKKQYGQTPVEMRKPNPSL